MTDWKKNTDDFMKFLNDTGTQFAKLVNDATLDLQDTAKKTRQKMELKSQIGEHTRALDKAYQRLGKAYYDAYESHHEVSDVDDVLALIKSNRKIVELLNEKLAAMEKKEAAEEKEKDEPTDSANDSHSVGSEIHID